MNNLKKKFVEEIKTQILCTDFFFFENRVDYKKMLKNIVERGMVQMAIWRTRIACWMIKATKYTLRMCNT